MVLRNLLIPFAAFLLFGAGASAAPQISLYTLDWAPFSWRDKGSGAVVGVAHDIISILMSRAGVVVLGEPAIFPWARGLAMTKVTSGACLFPVGRVPEREASYQWIGPIGQAKWVLFARSADKISLNSIEDARPYLVGTFVGDLSVAYLRQRDLRLDIASSDRLNPQKMERRRIDLWASASLPALHPLHELGISSLEPVFTFAKVDLYLACNRKMEDHLVTRLNSIVDTMSRDQTIQRIYTTYGYEKEAPVSQ